jgi:hypothetical protein
MHWQLILEEFSPELKYIKGKQNIIADAPSRLDMAPCTDEELSVFIHEHYAASRDEYPDNFPLSYRLLESEQKRDNEVKTLLCNKLEEYAKGIHKLGNHEYELIQDTQECIYIPKQLQE